MRHLLFLVLTFLAACAVREQVDFVEGPAAGTLWRPVLVATTRAVVESCVAILIANYLLTQTLLEADI